MENLPGLGFRFKCLQWIPSFKMHKMFTLRIMLYKRYNEASVVFFLDKSFRNHVRVDDKTELIEL